MSQDPNEFNNNNNNNNNKNNNKNSKKGGGTRKSRKRSKMGSMSPLKVTPERSGRGRFSRSSNQYSPNSPSNIRNDQKIFLAKKYMLTCYFDKKNNCGFDGNLWTILLKT